MEFSIRERDIKENKSTRIHKLRGEMRHIRKRDATIIWTTPPTTNPRMIQTTKITQENQDLNFKIKNHNDDRFSYNSKQPKINRDHVEIMPLKTTQRIQTMAFEGKHKGTQTESWTGTWLSEEDTLDSLLILELLVSPFLSPLHSVKGHKLKERRKQHP